MPEPQYAALANEKLVCIDSLWVKISQTIREQPRHGIRPLQDVTVAWFFHQKGSYENLFSLLSLGKKKRLAIGCLYRTTIVGGVHASSVIVDRST